MKLDSVKATILVDVLLVILVFSLVCGLTPIVFVCTERILITRIKAALDTCSHYVCIYLKSMRPTTKEIFMRIGHFRVALCLSFITSLRAKPLK